MSTVARTPAPPLGATSMTVLPGNVRASRSCSFAVIVSVTAGSSRGSSRSSRCTMVTTVPNMANSMPSSQATGPPPTTTTESGS
jgi:hypothetical protein